MAMARALQREVRRRQRVVARAFRWRWEPLVLLFVAVCVAWLGSQYLAGDGRFARAAAPSVELVDVQFATCSGQRRHTCVVDGDTFWLEGVKVRVSDIDTPEVSAPACPAEGVLGRQATERLVELLNAAPFEVRAAGARDADQYGRKLRLAVRNGQSLGEILVAEGLARRWDGARRSWCA